MTFAEGYVDVATRLADFYTAHPHGSLQPLDPARPYRWEEIDGRRFIVYAAAAYRTPDDPRPGIGVAWEPVPGSTPYTRGSEIMNAETSAWGRALAALGIATRQGIATAQDVTRAQAENAAPPIPPAPHDPAKVTRTRRTEPDPADPWAATAPPTAAQLHALAVATAAAGLTAAEALDFARATIGRADLASAADLTTAEAARVLDALAAAPPPDDAESGPPGPAPTCKHGPMAYRDFTSKAGNRVRMWKCLSMTRGDECPPVWIDK